MMPEPVPPPPAQVMEPAMNHGSLFRDMPPAPPPPQEMQEPASATSDDLEVPAFMRRERRLYQ
jgi:hypothetical protein